MISPHTQLLNICDCLSSLFCELPEGPIVVKPGHCAEVFPCDALGVCRSDQSVGVSGITHHQNLDVSVGVLAESLTLFNEDLSVLHEQITPLHTLGPWLSTNQESSIDVLET